MAVACHGRYISKERGLGELLEERRVVILERGRPPSLQILDERLCTDRPGKSRIREDSVEYSTVTAINCIEYIDYCYNYL